MEQSIFWALLGFIAGSIPFSVLVGHIFLRKDIRLYGDGNPGGTNAWKAGGWRIGLLAALLDISKGYLPVHFACRYGVSGWFLVPVALAPILGHAFSPLLKFRGGKALSTSGGVWLALAGPKILIVYALVTLPVLALQVGPAVAANARMLFFPGYTLWFDRSPYLVAFALLNMGVVAWKHRKELSYPIQLRPWITDLLRRSA